MSCGMGVELEPLKWALLLKRKERVYKLSERDTESSKPDISGHVANLLILIQVFKIINAN